MYVLVFIGKGTTYEPSPAFEHIYRIYRTVIAIYVELYSLVAISGPQKVWILVPTPSNGPRN